MDSISKDILFNVLYLKVGDSIGTGFCINYKEKRYLVTAKHLVEGMDKNAIDVGILRNGIYEHQIVKAFFHENENVDIVVLQATLSKTMCGIFITDNQPQLCLGQELYFAGFPFGLYPKNYSLNEGYPIPFVKHAYLSSSRSEAGYTHLWLDGINNPGFSGGPVIYTVLNKLNGRFFHCLAGVICSYRYDEKPIYDKNTGDITDYVYRENSGIVNAHGYINIVDIIEKNNL